MNEARITINGKELSEQQSMSIRVAVIAFGTVLSDPRMTEGMGKVALTYQLRLAEVMAMIDATEVEMRYSPPMSEKELGDILKFIGVLSDRVREERE
jgi:hypothetical protein